MAIAQGLEAAVRLGDVANLRQLRMEGLPGPGPRDAIAGSV
jgi:hypothetical protein